MPVKKSKKAWVAKVSVKAEGRASGTCCECSGGSCGRKYREFWAVLLVILIVVTVGYFAYTEYTKTKNTAYTVEEKNGVTTVSPGPGLVPDGPPTVGIPTTPPPTK